MLNASRNFQYSVTTCAHIPLSTGAACDTIFFKRDDYELRKLREEVMHALRGSLKKSGAERQVRAERSYGYRRKPTSAYVRPVPRRTHGQVRDHRTRLVMSLLMRPSTGWKRGQSRQSAHSVPPRKCWCADCECPQRRQRASCPKSSTIGFEC